jgi:hypothetical protein
MVHRYGRHGPHAWKRWWLRRADRCAPTLPVVARGSIVLHLHVTLATIERIIIVTVDEDSLLTHGVKGEIVKALPEGLGPELSVNIRYLAAEDAEQKAVSDLRQLDEGLTDLELPGYAEILWDKNNYAKDPDVRKEAIALREQGVAARDIYIQEFSAVYTQRFSEQRGTLLDANTKAIVRQGRTDKVQDAHHQVALSEREIVAQAAIRVYAHLRIDPQQQREALYEYIGLYEKEYKKYPFVQEGGDGSLFSHNGFRLQERQNAES